MISFIWLLDEGSMKLSILHCLVSDLDWDLDWMEGSQYCFAEDIQLICFFIHCAISLFLNFMQADWLLSEAIGCLLPSKRCLSRTSLRNSQVILFWWAIPLQLLVFQCRLDIPLELKLELLLFFQPLSVYQYKPVCQYKLAFRQ